MVDICRVLQQDLPGTTLLLQVHDELIFEVADREMAAAVPLIKEKMVKAVTLNVPLEVRIKSGRNWLEAE
jgi:DNA polymerase-1